MDLTKHKDAILNAFVCQNSGNCCKAEGVVYVSPKEIEEMATLLNIDVITFLEQYTTKKNGWRIIADRRFRTQCFLDKNHRCQIYAARPKSCKTYPDWPEIWKSNESLLKEIACCPGLKKAVDPFLSIKGLL